VASLNVGVATMLFYSFKGLEWLWELAAPAANMASYAICSEFDFDDS
jgi:hypothetical protein